MTSIDETHPDLCPAVIDAQTSQLPAIAEKQAVPEVTPAQARVVAVSNLLHKAYEKASTLNLTPEESKALQADFAESDFRTGAAGKENLIYIEHAALRARLNSVFGLGQWSLVVRNRWGEDFRTSRGTPGTRIYVEACLLVRGCFVAEAIGDMSYYPGNEAQNYGDAVEGAKSAALRRCAKELGVGLQAWRKDFCEGWMSRHGQTRPQTTQVRPATPPAPRPAPAPAPAPKPAVKQETPVERRTRFIEACIDAGGGTASYAEDLFREMGTLLETETMEDFPVDKVPATKKVADNILDEIRARAGVSAMPEDSPPPADQPVPQADGPESEPEGDCIRGWVAVVTEKPTSKGGTRYGVCITPEPNQKQGGKWLNTFDDIDGAKAKTLKGKEVRAYWVPGKYGDELTFRGIVADGEVVP